jgi:hypothetical protein
VMCSFANIDANEDLNTPVVRCHRYPLVIIVMGGQRPTAASLGIHVTSDRGMPLSSPISGHPLPTRPQTTSRKMDDWGLDSCRAKLPESQHN